MLTELEARTYLAGKLPELLIYGTGKVICWKPEQSLRSIVKPVPILETEWQQIALWVEEKMTDEQWRKYYNKRIELCPQNIMLDKWLASGNYISRATAMKESKL